MKRIFFFLLIVALWSSCQEKPTVAELVKDMVVQTEFDNTVAFQNLPTFSMSMDTIGLVSNTTSTSAIVSSYSKSITAQVRKNLEKAGYQFVAFNQSPRMGANIYVVFDRNVYQTVNYPGYYGGYPGYGGYYGYGGYGSYYNYPYISTYVSQQAILVVELADLNSVQNGNPKIIWSAAMGDIITTVDQTNKVLEAIDQAFTQSPYLHR